MEEVLKTWLYETYYPPVSKASAFLSFLVVLFMIGMYIYDRKLINRVSLRLQSGIALYDVVFHTGFLWRKPFSKSDSPMCTFIGWAMIYLPLFYAFLNVSIGVNLQLNFLHNKVITKRIEMAYWLIPILVPFIIATIPLAMSMLGHSKYYGCFLAEGVDDLSVRMFDLFAAQIWMLGAIIYLIIIVTLVYMKLKRGATFIDSNNSTIDTETYQVDVKTVKTLGYRILLYPICMIVSQLANILAQLHSDLGGINYFGLDFASIIFLGLTGILNFIAFFCDPTVHNAIKVVYFRITNKKAEGNVKPQGNFELRGDNNLVEEGNDKNDSYNDNAVSALIKSL